MNRLDAAIESGRKALDGNRFDEAIEHFEAAMSIRASFAPLVDLHLRACLKADEHARAWASAEHLALLDPVSQLAADAFRTVGKALDREGEGSRLAREIRRRRLRLKARRLVGVLGKPFTGKSAPSEAGVLQRPWLKEGLTLKQNLGVAALKSLLDRRQYDQAELQCNGLLIEAPEHAAVLMCAGLVDLSHDRDLSALDHFEAVLATFPDKLEVKLLVMRAAALAGKPTRGREILGGISEAAAATPDALIVRARLEQSEGRVDQALRTLADLREVGGLDRDAELFEAKMLSSQGKFDEAADRLLRYANTGEPLGRHFLLAATINRLTPGSRLFDMALKRAGSPELTQRERAAVHFALGQALRQAKEFDRAFDHVVVGNRLVDRIYDPAVEQEFTDQVMALYPHGQGLVQDDGASGTRLAFVFGLPRTGSTLTAQVLSSHPKAISVGETSAFTQCLMRATDAGYPERPLSDALVRELAAQYLELLPPGLEGHDLIVDKDLLKFQNLGLVRQMFPGARFIHCSRDHRDACFSIFCQYFVGLHSYAYRQDTLAHYAHLHDEIMEHWNRVMPGQIHQARYEAMVTDTEAEVRRLLDFVGLEFHPDCLAFQNAKGSVSTASLFQVRQPVYKTSVKAWEQHRDGLGELLEGLRSKPFQ